MSAPAVPDLLKGRVALVTGAVGAIGYAIAERFALAGAAVAIADLDQAATVAAAAKLATETGAKTFGAAVDVTDPASLEEFADRVEAELGICDTVVANAGILVLKPAVEITAREWDRVLDVNLDGAFHTASVFARRLIAAEKPGSIVFTSSLFGVRGGAGNSAYSATKFGMIGLAQSMAAELAVNGIRVNSVCPGQIRTAMLEELFRTRAAESGNTAAEEEQLFAKRIPLGRLGTATEVADAFLFLASDLSAYVTGQQLVVDGGWQVG